jgi:hypothetical protein
MPCRLRDIDLVGRGKRALVRRRFGYPGRIDAHERVWLIVAGAADSPRVRLNHHDLGPCARSAELEVTSLLRERNVLELTLESTDDDKQTWDEIALEIRCMAFLRNVHVRRIEAAELLIQGEIAGTCERPLDLYLLVDGVHEGYQAMEAGKSFQFTTAAPASTIRVELVDAATVWHSIELQM